MITKKAWEGASGEVALQVFPLPQAPPHTHGRAATAERAPPWMMRGRGSRCQREEALAGAKEGPRTECGHVGRKNRAPEDPRMVG